MQVRSVSFSKNVPAFIVWNAPWPRVDIGTPTTVPNSDASPKVNCTGIRRFGYTSLTCGSAARLAIAASSSAGRGGSGGGGGADGSAGIVARLPSPRRPKGTGPRPRPRAPGPNEIGCRGVRVDVTVIASNRPALVNRPTNCSCRPTPSDTMPASEAMPIETPSMVRPVRSLAWPRLRSASETVSPSVTPPHPRRSSRRASSSCGARSWTPIPRRGSPG